MKYYFYFKITPERSSTYSVSFTVLILFKTKLSSQTIETTNCLLHPKHKSDIMKTTLEVTLSGSSLLQRYDGYMYLRKTVTLSSSPRDVTGVFCTVVCGSKTTHGYSGGCKFAACYISLVLLFLFLLTILIWTNVVFFITSFRQFTDFYVVCDERYFCTYIYGRLVVFFFFFFARNALFILTVRNNTAKGQNFCKFCSF